jgi:ferrous iron transport protein B
MKSAVVPPVLAPRSEKTAVIVGLESSGKSAIFRELTGRATGDEANFRGSTVRCRRAVIKDSLVDIVDTPGIRLKTDTETTRLALEQLCSADVVVLVIRSTHAQSELSALLVNLVHELQGRRVALAITFLDKAPAEIAELAAFCRSELAVPVLTLDARHSDRRNRKALVELIHEGCLLRPGWSLSSAPRIRVVQPKRTLFENKLIGPSASLVSIALIFGLPVIISYVFAQWLQPIVDETVISPLTHALAPLANSSTLAAELLVGNYGILTLGWYSFLWAFPVVILISAAVALTEETGLKDRVTASLDPWLRKIGLSGRDLIPVLSGFGCNVVAVFQSRGCSNCNRRNCVSMIAIGSACSYQIGASLSIFNSGNRPWLFLPYLLALFSVGAIHTRIWGTRLPDVESVSLAQRSFLQKPTMQAIWWRVRATLRQFLLQAMPIFLVICVVGALVAHFGITTAIAAALAPLLELVDLPRAVAPGIVFSIIRKDGLLVLNQGGGSLVHQLNAPQLFLLVFVASTLTACLVTLSSIRKELGAKFAWTLAARQALTSVAAAIVFSIICRAAVALH